MKIPYERIVQWTAGPVSIGAGWIAEQLSLHANLGDFGTTKQGVAAAIVKVGTFAVGALATYLAHAKWLSNLTKWWDNTMTGAAALPNPSPSSTATVTDAETH